MKSITTSLFAASAIQSVVLAAPAGQDEPLTKRLENGLGRTPALGYNNWVSNVVTESDVTGIVANRNARTMEAAPMLQRMRLSKSPISWSL
jgi:hypothetical protein